MDAERITRIARNLRLARWGNGLVAATFAGTGLYFMLNPSRRDAGLAVGLGVFFLLLGGGIAMWVWRGDWTPPDAERFARESAVVDRVFPFAGAFELLVLSLAMLGLVFPDRLGEYWRTHRLWVALACAGLALEFTARLARHRAARSKRHERPEVSS